MKLKIKTGSLINQTGILSKAKYDFVQIVCSC